MRVGVCLKWDLWVSTGMNLTPAVRRHVAQDLWHLLEHRQTVDVDLQKKVSQN